MIHQPYQNDALDTLYELLFSDNPELFKANGNNPDMHPWTVLFADTPDQQALLGIANDRAAESRVRQLAGVQLRANGAEAPNPELLGVIIEVALDEGLDVLAAYGDGTARYLNHAQNAIIWESPTEASNNLIGTLWQHSVNVVNKIGPWDKERLPPPQTGMVRLSFLVSGQIFFGQGPMNVFFQDPMAGPVLQAATQLMQFLMQTSLDKD